MKNLARKAVLLSLVENLRDRKSWCSETHIQKTVYFLQTLLRVPLGFDFILYKHGPYSFELSDEIMLMRTDSFIKLIPQQPYGPSLTSGDRGELLKNNFPKTIDKYKKQVKFIAEQLGDQKVSKLEKVATALYVTEERSKMSRTEMAQRIHKLKKHVSVAEGEEALKDVEKIKKAAKKLAS